MSMPIRTLYYDFTPYEVNRVGRVAPEQHYYLTRSLQIGVFVGAAMALIPLCAMQQYAYNISSRWQHSTSQLDNLVQYVETFFFAAFVLIALLVGLRDMINNLRRQRELTMGQLIQGEGFLHWRSQPTSNKYAAEVEGQRLYFPLNSIYALFPGRYRFFYLPKTGMLVAAEWIDTTPPHVDLLQRLARTCDFSFGSLAANRAGQLSPEQASRLSPKTIAPFLIVFFGVLVMALIFVIARGPEIGGDYVLAILGVSFFLPLGIAYALLRRRSPRGPVSMSEGQVRKLTYEVEYVPTHFFEIDGKRFRVPEAAYDVLDESLRYRVYFLSKGNRLLSIEPLASETAPATL